MSSNFDTPPVPGTVATNKRVARAHHRKHGDMDGQTCLLTRCALHYPRAK